MPLYKATFTITRQVNIPVYAETPEDALAYIKRTDEWLDDGAFSEPVKDPQSLADVGEPVIEQVHTPQQAVAAGWDDDVVAWGDCAFPPELPQALYEEADDPWAIWDADLKQHARRLSP